MSDKYLDLDGLGYYTGKVKNITNDLTNRINNLSSLGRYLSTWLADTGLAGTTPPYSPYPYKTGDFMIVARVAAEGGTNYRPSGTEYVDGQPSTTVETEAVQEGDYYLYDGTSWKLMQGGSKGAMTDVQINGTSIKVDGVANIPLASNNLGVVKTTLNGNGGLSINGEGSMYIVPSTNAELEAKTQGSKPIVPSNLDKAVMEGLGNNSLTWSAAYKTSAQTTIGINTEQFVFTMADNSTIEKNIKVSA